MIYLKNYLNVFYCIIFTKNNCLEKSKEKIYH